MHLVCATMKPREKSNSNAARNASWNAGVGTKSSLLLSKIGTKLTSVVC